MNNELTGEGCDSSFAGLGTVSGHTGIDLYGHRKSIKRNVDTMSFDAE